MVSHRGRQELLVAEQADAINTEREKGPHRGASSHTPFEGGGNQTTWEKFKSQEKTSKRTSKSFGDTNVQANSQCKTYVNTLSEFLDVLEYFPTALNVLVKIKFSV